MSKILLLVTGLINTGFACSDTDHSSVCLAKARDDGCYWDNAMNCRCTNTCQSLDSCLNHPEPGDTDCMCRHAASACPGLATTCPATCNYKDTVVCDSPEDVPNAVPSSTVNKYMDKITYSCDVGYEELGKTYTGLRLCSEKGTWILHPTEGSPPYCTNTNASQTSGVYGDNVTYSCSPGHVDFSTGSGFYHCSVSGIWVPIGNLPNCQLVTCAHLPAVSNASPDQTNGIYAEVVKYSCDVGYKRRWGNIGQNTCNASGQWEPDAFLGDLPVCQKTCGSTPIVLHASPSSQTGFPEDSIHYLCDPGYRRVSGDIGFMKCNESLTWILSSVFSDPPVCTEISCGVPPIKENATANATSGLFSDVVVFSCSTGFSEVGDEDGQMICNESGLWSESELGEQGPACQIVSCEEPPAVIKARSSVLGGVYGDLVHYQCDVGYYLISGNIGLMTCSSLGTWISDLLYGDPPICTGVTCGSTPIVKNANANQLSGVFGDIIEYICIVGYVDNSAKVGRMTCNSSAIWDPDAVRGSLPNCQAIMAPPTSPAPAGSSRNSTPTPGAKSTLLPSFPVSTENPVKNIPVYKKYKPRVHEAKGGEVFGGFAIILLSVSALSIVLSDLLNIKKHIELASGNTKEADKDASNETPYETNNYNAKKHQDLHH